jgi:hypothetical protein
MPNLGLRRANLLVKSSSPFQTFMLDRLREESKTESIGLGQFDMALNDLAVEDLEFWIENNQYEIHFVESL